MNSKKLLFSFLLTLATLSHTACAGLNKQSDYGLFRKHRPRSILVIPPTNDTVEVDAPYIYLSTITYPLAEAGYYVFPVAVVDNYMKQNGLPTAHEMNSVSLKKIGEVFNADAVLYLHIEDWGQKYQVITSSTVVKAKAKLLDVKTGTTIWEGTAHAIEGSRSGGDGVLGMVIGAAIDQIIDTSLVRVRDLSASANIEMINSSKHGLLLGAYHPEQGGDIRGR